MYPPVKFILTYSGLFVCSVCACMLSIHAVVTNDFPQLHKTCFFCTRCNFSAVYNHNWETASRMFTISTHRTKVMKPFRNWPPSSSHNAPPEATLLAAGGIVYVTSGRLIALLTHVRLRL